MFTCRLECDERDERWLWRLPVFPKFRLDPDKRMRASLARRLFRRASARDARLERLLLVPDRGPESSCSCNVRISRSFSSTFRHTSSYSAYRFPRSVSSLRACSVCRARLVLSFRRAVASALAWCASLSWFICAIWPQMSCNSSTSWSQAAVTPASSSASCTTEAAFERGVARRCSNALRRRTCTL